MRAGRPALHCHALHCPTLCFVLRHVYCKVAVPDAMQHSLCYCVSNNATHPSAQKRSHHCARLLASVAVITICELGTSAHPRTSTHHAVIVRQRSHIREPKPLHNVANPSPYGARSAARTASLICSFVEVLCAATHRNDLARMQNCTCKTVPPTIMSHSPATHNTVRKLLCAQFLMILPYFIIAAAHC